MNFTQVFKLEFNIPESSKKINLHDSIYLMGSCFSDEVGKLLTEDKFNALSNPFGTIYNPYSLFRLLKGDTQSDWLIENQGVTYHWEAHGAISGLTEEEVANQFQKQQGASIDFLKKAKWLIITLGTAIVYELADGRVVANCHKMPASTFKKRFLTQEEIKRQFDELHTYLQDLNPHLQLIVTISPVRHVRDGLIENNQSKAILIDAVHSLKTQYSNMDYFPSYEIIMDVLRDYRFYANDMIHPSPEATQYVWLKFGETYFDQETRNFLEAWSKIKTALNHKPFQPKSSAHQTFLKTTLEKLEKLNEKIDVRVEIELLRKQIL